MEYWSNEQHSRLCRGLRKRSPYDIGHVGASLATPNRHSIPTPSDGFHHSNTPPLQHSGVGL